MHTAFPEMGQERRFKNGSATSGLPPDNGRVATRQRTPLRASRVITSGESQAAVWLRRSRPLIVSTDSLGTACPLSARNSTNRPVQILEAGSVVQADAVARADWADGSVWRRQSGYKYRDNFNG